MGRQSRPDVARWLPLATSGSYRDRWLLLSRRPLGSSQSPERFARPVRIRACAGRGLPSWSRGGRSDSSRLDCEEQVGALVCDEAETATVASGSCLPAVCGVGRQAVRMYPDQAEPGLADESIESRSLGQGVSELHALDESSRVV